MGLVTGIFTYIWLIFMVNVGKYTIHGSYGYAYFMFSLLSDSGVGQKIFSSWQFCEKVTFFGGGMVSSGDPNSMANRDLQILGLKGHEFESPGR